MEEASILEANHLLVQHLEIGLVLVVQGNELLVVVPALLVVLLDKLLYLILKA